MKKGFGKYFGSFSLFISEKFLSFKHKWTDFWSTKELVRKLIFTLFLITIFIVAGTITAPFVKIVNASQLNQSAFFGILNIVGGGGLRQFSIVSLGINPFITASLIMTILQSKLFPPIQKMSQSGPLGRKKINVITRLLTLVFAFPQAIVLTQTLSRENGFISIDPKFNTIANIYVLLPLILVAGSLFTLFLSEQITDKGIGNGTSLIIFSGISLSLPSQFRAAFNILVGTNKTTLFTGLIHFLLYLFGYLLLIVIIVFVYLAERRIPIQQTGAGLSKNIKEMGSLPIKVNPAGIMPVIFSMIVISFPLLIAGLLDRSTSLVRLWIERHLAFTHPIGFSLLIIITFIFSIFMGLQQSKIDKISEDFNKSGTFIPGLRPGDQTENYLIDVVLRLSIFSAFYLSILVSIQYIMQMAGMPAVISFGGTSMMILVSVSLETIDQIKARLKANKLSNMKKVTQKAISKKQDKLDNSGVLW